MNNIEVDKDNNGKDWADVLRWRSDLLSVIKYPPPPFINQPPYKCFENFFQEKKIFEAEKGFVDSCTHPLVFDNRE